MLNESLLIKRLKAKDNLALQELINEFEPRLFKAALLLTKNDQEAEELVCDTFTDVYFSIKRFKQESGFFSWLYSILLHKFYYRLKRRKREVVLKDGLVQVNDCSDNQNLVHFQQSLPDLLGRLSSDHQKVILLRYLEGMKLKDIAQVLKIPENRVKVRLHRALNNLRKISETSNLL